MILMQWLKKFSEVGQKKENNVVEQRGFLQVTDVYFQLSLGGIL